MIHRRRTCFGGCWWRWFNDGIREILYFVALLLITSTPYSSSSVNDDPPCPRSFPASCRCYVDDSKNVADCSFLSLTTWLSFNDQENSSSFQVAVLNVSYNDLPFVEFGKLSKLKTLKTLDASHNTHLNPVDDEELAFPFLQTLLLRKCGLVSVPSLSRLKSLINLDLRGNRIGFISSRNFRSVHRSLQVLDISQNALVSLPLDLFPDNNSLRVLHLSQNQISNLPKNSFRNLTRLEALNLSHNTIRRLPKDIFAPLIRLKDLDLGHNRLRRLEGLSFKGVVELRTLKLDRNRLVSLADGTFWTLPSLKYLSLAGNRLTSVDRGWVYGLEALSLLNLSANALVRLDAEAWHFCQRLEVLDLSANRLATLRPRVFHHLRSLRHLILRDNDLTLIYTNAFDSMSELIDLDLSSNLLADILISGQKIFLTLNKLKSLRLASNDIRVLPTGVFDGLVSLGTLDLDNNPLVVFSSNAVPMPGVLKLVILNTTSFLCDCQATWLLNVGADEDGITNGNTTLDHPKRGTIGTAECRHPREWAGRMLRQLPTNITCGKLPLPTVTSHPRSTTAFRGQNVSLECAAHCQEEYTDCHMTIHWRKNGRLLYPDPDSGLTIVTEPQVHSNGQWWSQLTIEAADDADSGLYQCQFANELSSEMSEKARLVVFVPPTLVKKPVDAAVRVGGTVRLECAAQGLPAPTLSWRKNKDGDEFPAAKERRMHLMPTDDVFFIVDVKLQDAGTYSCIAKSPAGEDRAEARVSVYDLDDSGRGVSSVTVPEITVRPGGSAFLECMSSSQSNQANNDDRDGASMNESTESDVLWFRNGEPMSSSSNSYSVSDGRVWIIKDASISDQGLYSCRLERRDGVTVERSWRLTIFATSDKMAKMGSSGSVPAPRSSDASRKDHKDHIDSATRLPPRATTTQALFDLNGIPGVLVVVVIACVVLTSLGWVLFIVWRRRRLSHPRGVATVVVSLHESSALTALVPDDQQRSSRGKQSITPTCTEPSVQVATITF